MKGKNGRRKRKAGNVAMNRKRKEIKRQNYRLIVDIISQYRFGEIAIQQQHP